MRVGGRERRRSRPGQTGGKLIQQCRSSHPESVPFHYHTDHGDVHAGEHRSSEAARDARPANTT